MNYWLFFIGATEILLALTIGVFLIYLGFQLLSRVVKDLEVLESLKSHNISVSIVIGTIIISIIFIVRGAIDPAVTVFTMIFKNPKAEISVFLTGFLIIILQILLSALIAFAGIFIAMKFFMWLTKDLQEIEEIRKNNIAVGIVLAVVIFSIALILEPGIKTLLQSFIPLPSVNFREISQ
ncbi:MAG: DUF350 domain-containing protein [Ignavibacteriaceae bacterium]|nr:DUF350 domain-containing protein [Ignavibacteriaceae bacterium]